jgi:hypothetical protein
MKSDQKIYDEWVSGIERDFSKLGLKPVGNMDVSLFKHYHIVLKDGTKYYSSARNINDAIRGKESEIAEVKEIEKEKQE